MLDASAVQLAEFLDPQLRKVGGIVTLADVYCLFNRARGTELISPDDLLQAVNLFPAAGAPMHLRTFPTGVLVVQSNSHDDNEVSVPQWRCCSVLTSRTVITQSTL